ncbi:MAG TPA: small multidrug efflux protein [Microbacterium sp.]|nr:small multidrug efflux protein [Microbacterium sp.]
MNDNPYPWLQDFINQVPDILQPLIVAAAGAIPYVEGEGAAVLGIIAGINPIVAAIAGAAGNILAVLGVVLLGSRIRGGVIAGHAARIEARKTETAPIGPGTAHGTAGADTSPVITVERPIDVPSAKPTRRSKGRAKLGRWMVRFGVPGASILAPLALPTMLTAAFFVASGVRKEWVILWQVVAILLWTGLVAAAATGLLALLGW